MDPSTDLASHAEVLAAWRQDGGDAASARQWTRRQVAACRALASTETGWARLLTAHVAGRAFDSWLATDWPSGFDELLLCAPLCKLVEFECARCTIGARQSGYSCAHPATVFGRLGVLLTEGDRASVLQHLDRIDAMLDPAVERRWNLADCVPEAPDGPTDG